MKLAAVAQRSSCKDLIDVFALGQRVSLACSAMRRSRCDGPRGGDDERRDTLAPESGDGAVSGRDGAVLGLASVLLGLAGAVASAEQPAAGHPSWPGKGRLFVGTCYQPVDRSPEEIRSDIALMRAAGFTLVRMGDLSWDSFEPSEGQFRFAWFDEILNQMSEAGIKVILDIGGLPAPIWLHQRYPSVNVVNQNGVMLQPARRYMEDVSDAAYREHATRFADELTRHYARNPALLAVGYDNEIGDGYMSYSAADRLRFIDWLKARYGTVEALNEAWATQRWSRRLNSFDQVQLPNGDGPSPSERYLDLRRFWSDQVIRTLRDLDAIRRKNMPDLPSASNLWDTAPRMGFDFHEVLEPRSARTLATFTNTPERSPAVTLHEYGKGRALYVAVPAQSSILGPVLRSLYASVGVERGPATPAGVCARVVEGRTLYVNTTDKAVDIQLAGHKEGVVTGRRYSDVLHLEPYEVDLLQ
jgi:beta-galactosidase GanA